MVLIRRTSSGRKKIVDQESPRQSHNVKRLSQSLATGEGLDDQLLLRLLGSQEEEEDEDEEKEAENEGAFGCAYDGVFTPYGVIYTGNGYRALSNGVSTVEKSGLEADADRRHDLKRMLSDSCYIRESDNIPTENGFSPIDVVSCPCIQVYPPINLIHLPCFVISSIQPAISIFLFPSIFLCFLSLSPVC